MTRRVSRTRTDAHDEHRTHVIPFPSNSAPDHRTPPPTSPPAAAAETIPFRRRAFYPQHQDRPFSLLGEAHYLLACGHVRAAVMMIRASMETDLVDVCDRLGCKKREHWTTPRKRAGILKAKGHISAAECRMLRKALRFANDAVHNQGVTASQAEQVYYAAMLLRLFTVWVDKRMGELPATDSVATRPGFDVEHQPKEADECTS
jgi:hypothetical protein